MSTSGSRYRSIDVRYTGTGPGETTRPLTSHRETHCEVDDTWTVTGITRTRDIIVRVGTTKGQVGVSVIPVPLTGVGVSETG